MDFRNIPKESPNNYYPLNSQPNPNNNFSTEVPDFRSTSNKELTNPYNTNNFNNNNNSNSSFSFISNNFHMTANQLNLDAPQRVTEGYPILKKKRLQVILTKEEEDYFPNLYQMVDKKNGSQDLTKLKAKDAANFMKKSNLSKETLKKIWLTAAHSNDFLEKDEFYVVLRLIALAQNNLPYNAENIENNYPIPPLPSFNLNKNIPQTQKNDNAFQLQENNKEIYRKIFEKNKESSGEKIKAVKAIEVWRKYSYFNNPRDSSVKKIADVLKPLEEKSYLNLKEFQVACHLLLLRNRTEIPQKLPDCLANYLGRKNDLNDINVNNNSMDFNNNGKINNLKKINSEYSSEKNIVNIYSNNINSQENKDEGLRANSISFKPNFLNNFLQQQKETNPYENKNLNQLNSPRINNTTVDDLDGIMNSINESMYNIVNENDNNNIINKKGNEHNNTVSSYGNNNNEEIINNNDERNNEIVDNKIQKALQKVDELTKKQENISNEILETKNEVNDLNSKIEALEKKHQEINKELDDIKKECNDLKEEKNKHENTSNNNPVKENINNDNILNKTTNNIPLIGGFDGNINLNNTNNFTGRLRSLEKPNYPRVTCTKALKNAPKYKNVNLTNKYIKNKNNEQIPSNKPEDTRGKEPLDKEEERRKGYQLKRLNSNNNNVNNNTVNYGNKNIYNFKNLNNNNNNFNGQKPINNYSDTKSENNYGNRFINRDINSKNQIVMINSNKQSPGSNARKIERANKEIDEDGPSDGVNNNVSVKRIVNFIPKKSQLNPNNKNQNINNNINRRKNFDNAGKNFTRDNIISNNNKKMITVATFDKYNDSRDEWDF